MLDRCPICGLPDTEVVQLPLSKNRRVSCAACGRYELAPDAWDAAGRRIGRLAPLTREASDTGTPLVITTETVGELLRRYDAVPVGAKIRKLLQLVATRAPEPGAGGSVNPTYDFACVGAASWPEMVYLMKHGLEQGLIETPPGSPDPGYNTGTTCVLTPVGWETLSPVAGGLPGTCFVAMWFDASLQDAFMNGIRPALESDCGYTVLQMAQHEHNNSITDEMLVQIRNAEFVVADVTGQRQNVYFEAGFALALGRPVIWSCRDTEAASIHFDTRQFSHILWQTPADLRRALAARVKATIQAKGSR